jgi:hypothetical protein
MEFTRSNREDVLNQRTTLLTVVTHGTTDVIGEVQQGACRCRTRVDVGVEDEWCGRNVTGEIVGVDGDRGVTHLHPGRRCNRRG